MRIQYLLILPSANIKDDISFCRCFMLLLSSSFQLQLFKTKSPKVASWPGILVSHKETRTKVVLVRKLGKRFQSCIKPYIYGSLQSRPDHSTPQQTMHITMRPFCHSDFCTVHLTHMTTLTTLTILGTQTDQLDHSGHFDWSKELSRR